MAKVISIEGRRAGCTAPALNHAQMIGQIAGEVILALQGIAPADLEEARRDILQTARKHAYKSQLKGVKRP